MTHTANTYEELSCQELVELVTDYLEGRLPVGERTLFEQHLVYCDWCRVYLEQMRQTIRMAGNVNEESLSPRTREELVRLFRDWKGKK